MALKQSSRKTPAKRAARAAAAPQPLVVIILAAGAGKRMKSALPKVLQPLAGRPLLQYVLDTARSLEPAAIHVVYGHGGEAVRAAFAHEPVSWVHQAQRLGTGHAVQQVAPLLSANQRVLILYGDGPLLTTETLRQLLQAAGRDGVGLLTVNASDPAGYGRVLRNARGGVQGIVEEADATAKQRRLHECNTGVMTLPAAALGRWLARLGNRNAQREYYLTDVIGLAVRERVAVRPLVAADEQEVQGVNDRVQLAAAESAWRARQTRRLLLDGATLADPARVDVRGTVSVGEDVQIDVNVVFEGDVRLGHGVKIGPNCVIRSARIEAGTEVFANCIIDRAIIGPRCRIGPFARIRPETELSEQVHVGNFVEVKKSRLGARTKANHLTYLGDAVIGADVNVGAGTVTCNYDGVNKSVTTIEDDVFIGSGSMLVAPVHIGAGANIGAGSTISRSAPAGQLTVARTRPVTIPGWKRPKRRDT
ncbi:MAG TPA: bifunctional UDP-N-acetylglucosamine diphosphorylase/glucosamine-1-phosphate N-acetyltransferase GlmU [Steroidobacteraceae bacterium]|nr:bifunctional UDP-N-acetylglucosamine diphosphorylase/glucosamine-1-phosphate N-acetyltransferase GlmU [Steroidobacteraceae bacterium]